VVPGGRKESQFGKTIFTYDIEKNLLSKPTGQPWYKLSFNQRCRKLKSFQKKKEKERKKETGSLQMRDNHKNGVGLLKNLLVKNYLARITQIYMKYYWHSEDSRSPGVGRGHGRGSFFFS
jgi:hypothetical protein